MAAAGQKDSPSVGSILHCSLLLIGYKASVYEADISASMFHKANIRGLESLLHFLLTKLRGVSQSKKASLACNMCTVLSQPGLSLTTAIETLFVVGLQRCMACQRHAAAKRLPQGVLWLTVLAITCKFFGQGKTCRSTCHFRGL